jgi:hypothetical protein
MRKHCGNLLVVILIYFLQTHHLLKLHGLSSAHFNFITAMNFQ